MSKIDLDFFEKIIIQQVLKKDNTYLASCVDHLEKELFKNKDIAAIIGTIKEFYLERDAIPTFTELKTRLNSPEMKAHLEKVVKEIKDLDKDRDEDELIANTEYFLKQRKTDLLLEKAVDEKINDKEVNLDEFQKESEKIGNICLVDNLGLDYFQNNEQVVKYLQETDTFISTGYKVVDDAFSGGLFSEGRAIYGIAGSTNSGKSLLVGNIATNVIRQGMDVVIITLEMSEKRYAKRISGMLTGIAINELSEKIDNYKEYIKDFISDNKSRLIIKEFAAKSVTAGNIKAFIQRLGNKRNFRPRVICLDYHTLCKTTKANIPKHDEFQYLTQEVRRLTYDFEAPLITPAQLNRDGHRSNGAGLDNMAGSYSMLSDFDNVTIISQTDEDRELNQIQVKGCKARDGAINGGGILKVDYNTLRFFEEGMVEKKSEAVRQMENLTEHLDFSELFENS
jgi:replicative DNA helicase